MTNNLQSAAVSDRGLSEKRPQNEDSFLEMPARGLFAVADGVGGAQAGDVASQMAMEILQEAFTNARAGGDAEDLMQLAIERANEAIYQMSHDLPQLSTMATTVVALHVDGNIATIGHVGDSRLYRVDAKGNLFRETQDHSVVEEEVRAGRMTAAQAATHPSRNVISRALGADHTVQVDLKTIMFEPNTTFLLCSDGITRHIEDHELRQLLNSANDPAQICDDMKHICYARGAEDNLTAVIIRVAQTADSINGDFSARGEDMEEATVATARGGATSALAGAGATTNLAAETSALESSYPGAAEDDFKTVESFDAGQFTIPASSGAASETVTDFHDLKTIDTTADALIGSAPRSASAPVAAAAAPPAVDAVREEKVFSPIEEEKSGGGFLGKLLGSLVLLLIGAGVGAGAYYFWQQSQNPAGNASAPLSPATQQTPQITQMQSSDIPFSAFEKNRRNVDGNPEQYIKTNGQTAQDAEDYYLLGRAHLLLEQYKEAWANFDKAKKLLPQIREENRQTLANEIALGGTIINVEAGKRFFRAERENLSPANQTKTPNENTSVNASGDNPAAAAATPATAENSGATENNPQ